MLNRELSPHPLLAPYVNLIWTFESDDPSEFGPPDRILPDGIVELVFHYRDPLLIRFGESTEDIQPRSSAVSQTSRFIEIRPTGGFGLISVRFFPWGACQFFPMPVSEFADGQVPADILWGKRAVELEERICSASTLHERIRLVERFLLEQLRRYAKEDTALLIRHVWDRRGQVAIGDMTREVGISERQLERRFLEGVGVGPKQFTRLARFLDSCRQIRKHADSLTRIAHHCGYYDQSHFIRDFKRFSGLTPNEFRLRSDVSFLRLE